MPNALQPFIFPDKAALQFACKTLLGAGLALWLAMRFDLEQPQWAMMTAFIVAQPLSGMVLQKGLARVIGTLVGTCMAVVLMGLAAQAPWLFLGCLAAWLWLCTAASTLLRSAWSYSFVLAGYTVMLIGLPALAEPVLVFDHAVARCTEILLGISCATLTSAVLWPQRVQLQLAQQAEAAWRSALASAQASLQPGEPDRQGLLEMLGRIVAVDAQREHAWFEGPRGRIRARGVRALGARLLTLLRTARAVRRQLRELSEAERVQLAPWLDEVRAALQSPDLKTLRALRERLIGEARQPDLGANLHYCLGRLALLLEYAAAASEALEAVEEGREPEDRSGELAAHRDLALALAYGLRSALTFTALATFWMFTGWTAAVGAMILAAVVCGLFASRDNAVQIGFSFLRGIAMAIPVAFVVGQLLLPQWSGFAMLCLGLGVPLFFGALGMARPALAGTATSFCLHTIVLVEPQNLMRFDVAYFFDQAIAMLIGVGCAVAAFRLISLRHPAWHGRRLLEATLRDLGELTSRRLAGAETWFAGRMADRLLQLARHHSILPPERRKRWDDGLLGLDMGDELLHLRLCLAAARPAEQGIQMQALQALQKVLIQGPSPQRRDWLDTPAERLHEVLASAAPGEARRLGEAAVEQLRRSWRQWCRLQEETADVA
ncbi:FUSC family protein [Stutzerimonas azotifigens]|uniref:FUSC family protein n=1 Tax=Stutzerimonas azotifigens TaxID=291995 RepID=A0ABR5YWS2_9GAMM|nr:FUSC family protein [Stutzerimonas azotifigens]MBA1272385.1 FUSC family protein [Stutzerimonas azotifigens]